MTYDRKVEISPGGVLPFALARAVGGRPRNAANCTGEGRVGFMLAPYRCGSQLSLPSL